MPLGSFIKKNKVFSAVSMAFLAWFVFLIILSIINIREITFLDVLDSIDGTDVSAEYKSTIPFLRYLFEPVIGISFLLDKKFKYLIAVSLLYPTFRLVYLYLKKQRKFDTKTFKKLKNPIYNFIRFVVKLFSLTLITIAVIFLIGYIFAGYYFVSRYFMVIIQVAIRLCCLLLIVKISYLFIIFLNPTLTFKSFPRKILKKVKKKSWSFKYSDSLKKEVTYFIGIIYLMLSMNILLISAPFPTQKINANVETDEFLFDFHVHTTMSDGWISPEERVRWYIEQGIDGAAFTDHDNIRGALIARNYVERNNLDFVVWIGAEWTDNEHDIHMNYYGLEEEIVAPLSSTWLGISFPLNASDMITYVKSKGGYVIVNHYNYDSNPRGGFGVPFTLEQLRNWGVDGFEILNGDDIQAKQIREFCLNNTNSYNESLICIGGSDIEKNKEINVFVKLNLENPSNKTIDNIFKNLRRNNHSVIKINLHSDLVDFPGAINTLGFKMLEDFLNYLFNLNSFQALSWLIWSGLAYIILFLFHRRIKQVKPKLNNKYNLTKN
ncbi:MAG: PHP domain-containing protein [Promethearchaeota archaeon]